MWKKNNTKDNLIPFEQSRRIIQLDRRGKEHMGRRYAAVVTAILAVASIAYCLCIRFFMGYGTYFFLIWGVIGILLGGFSYLLWNKGLAQRIPLFVRRLFWICLAVGLIAFVAVEGMILSDFSAQAQDGADYCIVLGAQWKKDRPSYILKQRLDKAVEYLERNPDTYVIVSGGQGRNETISEAEGMALYLENAGIAAERIIQENASGDTGENLEYSGVHLDKEGDRVVIVTNNFHVYRAVKIARKKGYIRVEGLAADSYPAMLPNNMLREFCGVLKDYLVGNM